MGVARKVQPRHVQALFIGGLRIERDIAGDGGHADHGEVLRKRRPVAERKRMIARRDGDLFREGILQVKVAPKQRRTGKCKTGAHGVTSFGGEWPQL